ncbi:MAG TPA: hypothetical protein VJU83_10525 [Burkholderiales bacterium]|nr:hypothetical protein [Burkholderiales bacterium]
MKKFVLLLASAFVLTACSTTYDAKQGGNNGDNRSAPSKQSGYGGYGY